MMQEAEARARANPVAGLLYLFGCLIVAHFTVRLLDVFAAWKAGRLPPAPAPRARTPRRSAPRRRAQRTAAIKTPRAPIPPAPSPKPAQPQAPRRIAAFPPAPPARHVLRPNIAIPRLARPPPRQIAENSRKSAKSSLAHFITIT